MAVWATSFPATGCVSQDLILTVAKQWLVGSPHHRWTMPLFPADPTDEVVTVEHLGQSVAIARVSSPAGSWSGFRHVWTEKGEREWITEIIARRKDDSLTISIRLDCNLLYPGDAVPSPQKPHIVKLLLDSLGGGPDSWLTVSDAPTLLAEAQVDHAAAVINGTTDVRLPIVYVTPGPGNRPYLDTRTLAQRMAGMAHVVVEPSRAFSFVVARHVARNNPYGGAVSIFWPRGDERQIRYLPRDFPSPATMAITVEDRVKSALATVRPSPELTWTFIQELISKAKLDRLRAQGSTELAEFVSAFDSEIAAKDERLKAADVEIARLKAENRRMAAAGPSEGTLLSTGSESEYYPGELLDAVVATLALGKTLLNDKGRRLDIIDDLLRVNHPSGNEEELTEIIKASLAKDKSMTAQDRKALESIGFRLTDDGKHYKGLWEGDGRYSFSLSRTGSDYRGGKNMASTIIRTLFK